MNIAILASGAGSNAANIIQYFKNTSVKVKLIACNNPDAGIFQIAKDNQIDSMLLTKENFKTSDQFVHQLQQIEIDLVILAGFLWLVPTNLVKAFEDRIINIHPALLPKFGGKGMYGHFVHEAVHEAKEIESGITIHLVNEEFDKGEILFQAKANVENCSASEIEQKVRALEIEHFPKAIENFISKM
jgi:phosphoribosylglycinamide formyltransferase-1